MAIIIHFGHTGKLRLKNLIKKEVRKLFEDGPNFVGLPTPNVVNRTDGAKHREAETQTYSVEYFDTQMGTKELSGGYKMVDIAKANAVEFYKDEKANNHLGTVTDYIGVNSDTGNEFWILYVNKSYLDGMHRNTFNSDQAYQNWMKTAYKVMKTGKPSGGKFNLKEIEMDFPSGLANTSGTTSALDVIKAKGDFTDRNFPPDIKIKKNGPYYVFYGETFNVRDIFELMQHHTLIPFQLKVINDAEYWITKSKETAQRAIEMINLRYPKSKDTKRQ